MRHSEAINIAEHKFAAIKSIRRKRWGLVAYFKALGKSTKYNQYNGK